MVVYTEQLQDGTPYSFEIPDDFHKNLLEQGDKEQYELLVQERKTYLREQSRSAKNMERIKEKQEEMEKLRESFKLWDADGSGFLDKEEVLSILMFVGPQDGAAEGMSEADAKEFISFFDVNADGKMDVNEFIDAMKAMASLGGLDSNEDAEIIAERIEDDDNKAGNLLHHGSIKDQLAKHENQNFASGQTW